MEKFEREWSETGGRRYLYVRPRTAINNDDWMAFMEAELDGFSDGVFRILVDVVGVEEDIGIDGFSRVSEFLKALGVHRARFAVLPADQFYSILATLFDRVAESKGLELEVELFHQRSAAEAWLGEQ